MLLWLVEFVCCLAVPIAILMILYHYNGLKSVCDMNSHVLLSLNPYIKGSLCAEAGLGARPGISRLIPW